MAYSAGFGKLIKQVIAESGGPREVGQKTGVHKTTVYDWINGQTPRPETLANFCSALSVNAETRAELFRMAGYVERPEPGAVEAVHPVEDERQAIAREAAQETLRAFRDELQSTGDLLIDGARALEEEFGVPVLPYLKMRQGLAGLSPQGVRQLLDATREYLLELKAEEG